MKFLEFKRNIFFCAFICATTTMLAQATFLPFSNLGQPFGEAVGVWSGLSHAASFTTGNAASSLFSVSISMDPANHMGGSFQSFNLSLWSDVSGSPGTNLAMLSGNNYPIYTGIYAYTNTSPLVLSANTTYWIVASSPDSLNGNAYEWILTFSPATDPGAFWTMGVSKYNQGSGWYSIGDSDFLQFSVTVTNPQPPAVSISRPIVLTFPTDGFSFVLQQNSNLTTTNWINVTNATLSGIISNQNVFIVPPNGQQMFYRLGVP